MVGTSAGSLIAESRAQVDHRIWPVRKEARFTLPKSLPTAIFNSATGFMEAHHTNGAWVGPDNRYTEDNRWVYSSDVVCAIQEHIT
jgi:hypothetical protein